MGKGSLTLMAMTFGFLASCQMGQSIKKDFSTGILYQGNGIECGDVYLTNGIEELDGQLLTYGSRLHINFGQLEGFSKKEGRIYPGMELLVLGKEADTVLYQKDLYEKQSDGYEVSPLTLQANLVLADPIHSQSAYEIYIRIWDKLGKGSFSAIVPIEVVPDERIRVEASHVTYKEIYLFSMNNGEVLTEGPVRPEEDFYLIVEGLTGFVGAGGKSRVQLNIQAKDANGKIIASNSQLLPIATLELEKQMAPYFRLPGEGILNPVDCEFTMQDLNGDARLQVNALVHVVK